MWLHTCLEEVNALRTIAVGGNLLAIRILYLWHVVYERNHVAKELHETTHAHVLACANAEYREDAPGNQSLANTLTHLVFRKMFLLEELLHQGFIILSCRLDKCLVQFFRLIHFLGGNILDNGSTSLRFPTIFLHQQYVDE